MDRRHLLVASVILGLTGAFGQWMRTESSPSKEPPRVTLPFLQGGWEGNPYEIGGLLATEGGPVITRQYRFQGGMPINLLIRPNSSGHLPSVCYQVIGWRLADEGDLVSSSGRYRMSGLLGQRDDGNELLVYYGVQGGGRILKDGMRLKYEEIRQRLAHREMPQYFIEITTLFPRGHKQKAKAYLQKFMDDMGDLLPGVYID